MSIVKMDKLTVVGLKEQREELVDALMRLGAVALIETEADLSDGHDETAGQTAADAMEQPVPRSNDADSLVRLESAIDLSQRLYPVKKKPFSSRRTVDSKRVLDTAGQEQELMEKAKKLDQNRSRLSDLSAQKHRQQTLQALFEPWSFLDLDLSQPGTLHTMVFLGHFDTPETMQKTEDELRETVPETILEVVSQDETGVRCVLATLKPHADQVRNLLRRGGFHLLPETEEPGTPALHLARIEERVKRIDEEIKTLENENKSLALQGPDFEVLHDYILIRYDRQKIAGSLSSSQNTFWLEGWIPSSRMRHVKTILSERFIVAIDSRPADPDDDFPILLRNNWFSRPFEVIVEMFSPPGTQEKDPTPLLAPFFFFFFGMMLSDIGYGLMLSGLCAFLLYKVNVKGEMERMARMLMLCGFSSILWGFLFGGFFGDMLSVLSGGRVNVPAIWFNPMDDAIQLMIWSMIFGVIHLFFGMAARARILFMTGQGKAAILDIFPWYLVITGAGLMISGLAQMAGQVMAILGVAILVLFGGRDAKNPIMRLLKGILSLYDVTGYISDILSYTRILALVLATSVVAMVVNLLGFMGGPSVQGFIIYTLIAIFGHTLNLALSGLSAYVHTSRLHYVEFFSKFYEGGGRLWKPLKIKTRYVDIVPSQSGT